MSQLLEGDVSTIGRRCLNYWKAMSQLLDCQGSPDTSLYRGSMSEIFLPSSSFFSPVSSTPSFLPLSSFIPPTPTYCLFCLTHLDSVLKSKDITLPTKSHIINAMVFPIVMYGCESWTIKKAEHQTIDAFELWRWRRLLRVPWTARRSNQCILKEINPEYSLGELMLQSFGHLM